MSDLMLDSFRKFIAPVVRGPLITGRTGFEPEIIVRLGGSLGRQMWQYAIGRAAAIGSGLPVSYDVSCPGGVCELEAAFPGLELSRAPAGLAAKYRLYFYTGDRARNVTPGEDILGSKRPKYLGGKYMNAACVDQQGDALRDEFTFKPALSDEKRFVFSSAYMEEFPVAVHLCTGLTTGAYFRAAVRNLSERISPGRAVYYVFSADSGSGGKIFSDMDEEFVYVEAAENCAEDMYLMSRFRHFIISNSLFGWWPAWLSRRHADKIVVMPDKWRADERPQDALPMLPDGWTALRGD
ncbi:MAG: alpha-1,2-fucosyltransferase [Synergistaceae bacterium]|jgi:hypothetical protein|nr:alpha-1,2-fucosyltransferase [Synergistaceae bacterium]